jgi:Fe-S-cluster containining protein
MSCDKHLKMCRSWCCRFLLVEYRPIEGLENDTLFLSLRGLKTIEEGTRLLIPSRCRWLNNRGKCKMYEYRPKSCVAYRCEALIQESKISNHAKKEDVGPSA